MSSSCIGRCTMESHCASINIGPSIKDHVLCQLSDSDRILHPEDLRPKEGFTYRGTEVKKKLQIQSKEILCYFFLSLWYK